MSVGRGRPPTLSAGARFRDPDWRTRHCAEPAAEAILEATGRDPWDALGGCPRSWREAAALYRRLGVTNLKDAVSALLGSPVDPKLARRSDIAMVDGSLGIVRGELVQCVDRMQPIGRSSCCWPVSPPHANPAAPRG